MQELHPIDASYFEITDDVEATEEAVRFVNALRRVGLDFPSIHVRQPCDRCGARDHVIVAGPVSLDEARAMTATVTARMDELDRFREALASASALADTLAASEYTP
ncbi:hypothetical protein ACIQHY_21210 [Streptomyces sp. NPDC092359]|uniref:hypothetical protein n=1 Tax=Streptomyces sp. NPDC092359 TaxID=3366014 RepID=UPI0038252E64